MYRLAVHETVATGTTTNDADTEAGTSVDKRDNTTMPSTNKRLQQLLDEYADIFKPGHGTIRGQEAVVHIYPKARPGAFPARPVSFPPRKAVEAELDRLTSEGILEPVDPISMVTPIEWASPIIIAIK